MQDVNAPKQAVWNQILDLNSYKGKVNRVLECKNYVMKHIDTDKGRRWNIKTKMVVSVLPGYRYEYYCDHIYAPDCDSLTWSLDYDKLSGENLYFVVVFDYRVHSTSNCLTLIYI